MTIEHSRVLQAPLELPLALVKVAAVDPGPAKAAGQVGRFPVLRRVGPTTVIPRQEGIEGWLWTSTGGTALTNLGEDDEAPNVALLFTKPLDERCCAPRSIPSSSPRSPRARRSARPTVLGVLFRVADTLPAKNGFKRWGFQDILTDREIPPVQRRHLPTDKAADPTVRGAAADDVRAKTSVAPPGLSDGAARYRARGEPRRRTRRRPRPLPRLPGHRHGDLEQGRQPARGAVPLVRRDRPLRARPRRAGRAPRAPSPRSRSCRSAGRPRAAGSGRSRRAPRPAS